MRGDAEQTHLEGLVAAGGCSRKRGHGVGTDPGMLSQLGAAGSARSSPQEQAGDLSNGMDEARGAWTFQLMFSGQGEEIFPPWK